jgi:gamma-glutamyltranspeptidase / glutathione hydrolase
MNGIGGDLFAIVWDGERLHGLNASGRSPRAWTRAHFARHERMPTLGWDAVTVPGAVSGWRALSQRFGRLAFGELFEPALRHARDGWLVSPTVSRQWDMQMAELRAMPDFVAAFAPGERAPRPGERFTCPGQAATLEAIARSGGEDFYRGKLAAVIAAHARATGGLLDEEDLASHQADWVDTIRIGYGGLELHEIGPNGQGISALMALGMLERAGQPRPELDSVAFFHLQIEAMKLALADAYRYVADPAAMNEVTPEHLLDAAYLAARAKQIDPAAARFPGPGKPHEGGTVYLTAADERGMMVSLIQSNYLGFGSGIVIPGTGIAMHNRGAGFSLVHDHPNEVGPRKRPFHTIIPGFLMREGQPVMSFGVMGGTMQAQGHVQVTTRIAGYGQNPQAVVDAPRWRLLEDNRTVAVEWNFPAAAVAGLRALGHDVQVMQRFANGFGASQAIQRLAGGGYVAATDPRKDGVAIGF